MSYFDDNDAKSFDLREILQVIDSLSFESLDKAYLKGIFEGMSMLDSNIQGRDVEKALDHLRDNTSDPISSDEVEKLRTQLEEELK